MSKVTFRTFKKGDYEMCCDWWKWWWKGEIPVKKAYLPPTARCFVIESNNTPVAASFLYNDELMGYITWTVSNPEYKKPDRRQMLELLIQRIEKEAKEQWGIKFLMTVCGNAHMEKIHSKLDWYIEKSSPSYEAFKYL